MAESIARGVVKSGILPASRIRTAHTGSARRTAFESFGVTVFDNNTQVISLLIKKDAKVTGQSCRFPSRIDLIICSDNKISNINASNY